jgi:hypothetical protein
VLELALRPGAGVDLVEGREVVAQALERFVDLGHVERAQALERSVLRKLVRARREGVDRRLGGGAAKPADRLAEDDRLVFEPPVLDADDECEVAHDRGKAS